MAISLAPIYLDDKRVSLQGEPKPKVFKILEADGRRAENFQVVQLVAQGGEQKRVLRPDDVIDRTQHADQGVYLKCIEPAAAMEGDAPSWTGPKTGATGATEGPGTRRPQANR